MNSSSTTASSISASSTTGAELVSTVMDTPVGPITIVASARGVRAILWPDDDAAGSPSRRPLPILTIR